MPKRSALKLDLDSREKVLRVRAHVPRCAFEINHQPETNSSLRPYIRICVDPELDAVDENTEVQVIVRGMLKWVPLGELEKKLAKALGVK